MSPGSFPFSSQLTSSIWGCLQRRQLCPNTPSSWFPLLSPAPQLVTGSNPQPVPDGCTLLGCWMQRGRGTAQRSPKDLQIAHDVYFTSCKTFCRGFIYTLWLK